MAELAPEQVYPSDLTDAQWAVLAPLLAKERDPGHPQRYNLRTIVGANLYLLRSGGQWRMLPRDFPRWQAVRYHFDSWRRAGTWARVLTALREQARVAAGWEPTPTAGSIDSQRVKASEAAEEVGWDGRKSEGTHAPPRRRHARPPADGDGDTRRCA